MKQPILCLIIILSLGACGQQKAKEISTKINSLQEVVMTEDNIRSENIKIVEKCIKDLREMGKLVNDPTIVINKKSFTFQEYTDVMDTLSVLGKGKVVEIATYSSMCAKEVRKLYSIKGNSELLIVEISDN